MSKSWARVRARILWTIVFSIVPASSPALRVSAEEARPVDACGDPLPAGALARLGTARLRHDHSVLCVALSPDGNTLASGGDDYTVRLWDLATGRELRQIRTVLTRLSSEHAARSVLCVAYSPTGQSLAAGFGDSIIRVWDLVSGKEVLQMPGHKAGVYSLAFSSDGKTLASGSADQTVRLWDTATGKELRQLASQYTVASVAFSPDRALLASGATDGSVRIWRPPTGVLFRVIEAHQGAVHSVAFSTDGTVLASAGQDKMIRLWDVTPAMNPQFSPVLWAGIPLSLRPNLLALVQGIEFFRLNRELRQLEGHQGEVKSVAFSPDGQRLASGSLDQTLRLWNVATGKEEWNSGARLGPVYCVAFSRDGRTLATGDANSTIRLWDVSKRQEITLWWGHQGAVGGMRFSDDGRFLATAGNDGTIRLWELATGKEVHQFLGRQTRAKSAAFSADGSTVATGSQDGTVRFWDVVSGKELRQLKGHQGAVLSVMFAPDGKRLASSGEDRSVRLWDVASGTQTDLLQGHKEAVQTTVFSPDGKTLATSAADATVYLWDVSTGQEIRQLAEHGSEVDCIAFSPDGRTLAAGSRNGIVRLWEVATGKIVRELDSPSGPVLSLAFSADGKTLVAGGWLSVRFWEIATGKERACLYGQQGEVVSFAFSPDGRTLAAGNSGTSVLIWDVTGRRQSGQLPMANLSAPELESLWTDLAEENATKAYRSVWTLVTAAKQSVPFLRERLRPAPFLDAQQQKRISQLIAELDGDEFTMREQAEAELQKLIDLAEPMLRRALEGRPTSEVRGRVERLLEKLQEPARVGERIRVLRAIEVLEQIRTPEAREVLEAVSHGAPDSGLTQGAKAALERLAKRLSRSN